MLAKRDEKERLIADLRRRQMLCNDDWTVWCRPSWREVPASGEPGAPQALADASPRQKRLVEIAHATPPCGTDACAAWVEAVWSRMELGTAAGSARDLYWRYCGIDKLRLLCVGMVVAVPCVPYTPAGAHHGHAGLYVGDGTVMDCADDRVRHVPLDLWLSTYGVAWEPRWGWLAHVPLA